MRGRSGRKHGIPAAAWAAAVLILAGGCGPGEQEPPVVADAITTGSGLRMVRIPGGAFLMGSATGARGEGAVRRVRIDPFLMDQYEVTQAEFARYFPRYESKFRSPDNPMEQLNWQDAVRYCNKRSAAEGLEPCYTLDAEAGTWRCDFTAKGYRLATEAEWEYACRAGTTSKYFFGDSPSQLGLYAWYEANAGEKTHPVGRKRPNPWGLYDMLGNVGEWCNDPYKNDAQAADPRSNPRGPSEGDGQYVLRGGAFGLPADSLRSASRRGEVGYVDNCEGREFLGFRCVRSIPATESQPATDP